MSTHLLITASLHLPGAALHAYQALHLTAGSPPPPSGTPSGLGDALDKISKIADFISGHFLVIGVSLCTLIFGWGGLLWIVSGSSPQLRRTAVSTWWHAAIGLVGVIAATPIVDSLKGFFS